jgi:hypothetical protein
MLRLLRELVGFAEYAAPAVIAICGGALFLAFLVRGAAV